MKTYVGVTDDDWFRFLAARPTLTEANFWLPKPPKNVAVIAPGEPMIFKTHHPHNVLVGGGYLSDYRLLPLSLAWQTFGEANGCPSEMAMRTAIGRYRGGIDPGDDPVIGCLMLRDTAYFPAGMQVRAPRDFAKNIVRGKGYILGAAPAEVETAVARLAGLQPAGLTDADLTWIRDGPMFGPARPVAPRLGQDAFAAVVSEAYRLRCAITGAKVRPVLQAAHIRPVASEGQHRVDNGLLLRADVHIMFDKGYLGVDPARRTLHVSKRIREAYGNGQEFYSLADTPIAQPERIADRPNSEFLTWYMDEVFQG